MNPFIPGCFSSNGKLCTSILELEFVLYLYGILTVCNKTWIVFVMKYKYTKRNSQ